MELSSGVLMTANPFLYAREYFFKGVDAKKDTESSA
ncbi:hypothetical protein HDF25_001734 [Pedobacter cryoconitis]|uniref:Uncharacterized protein n=1 Tax=Pedobacter cryoconitis TaxID=188932 RepID=A0A7X0MHQ6_9SPHI|nr:hypothetical protein [Pedobacter cryoconitis]